MQIINQSFTIDTLTNSIQNRITGDSFRTNISLLNKRDIKILKGNKTAFRRLKKDGVFANIEGEQVHTFYHSASRIKNLLLKDFKNFKVENICFLAPTGNHVDFPEKYPKNIFPLQSPDLRHFLKYCARALWPRSYLIPA